MKERPIIFSDPSVRAILDGRKTQMRRVLRRQPPAGCTNFTFEKFPYHDDEFRTGWYDNFGNYYRCPYGCPGDRLLVRDIYSITLEITDVRVQRVQEITEAEAKAEGVHCTVNGSNRLAFATLWDSINIKRGFSWADNPWVWAITFRRVEGNLP